MIKKTKVLVNDVTRRNKKDWHPEYRDRIKPSVMAAIAVSIFIGLPVL